MFTRRLPKWVSELPDSDINKELLQQIFAASKSPLESPRKLMFAIKNLGSDDAKNAALHIEQRGWVPHINVDNKDSSKFWIEAERDQYRITEEILTDEAFFVRTTELYGAIYDGWYAQVV